MASVSESKIETISVSMKRDDVRSAIVEAARKEVQSSHHRHLGIDNTWMPQVVEDNYGGYTVYFRREEKPKPNVTAA